MRCSDPQQSVAESTLAADTIADRHTSQRRRRSWQRQGCEHADLKTIQLRRLTIQSWSKAGTLFYAQHIRWPVERFWRRLHAPTRTADRSEKLIQTRRQISPGEFERMLDIVIDDLVLDPAAEVRGS